LTETVAAFHRVEALHFDAKASSKEGPFTARRLSFTTPEGDEKSRVVFYDNGTAEALTGLVEEALARAEELVGGPHGRDGLTALLVERVLRSTPELKIGLDHGADEAPDRKARSGN
jgi:hypothetical protein